MNQINVGDADSGECLAEPPELKGGAVPELPKRAVFDRGTAVVQHENVIVGLDEAVLDPASGRSFGSVVVMGFTTPLRSSSLLPSLRPRFRCHKERDTALVRRRCLKFWSNWD
jgi:hypothetical protein